jgi:hypothetical protein
MGFSSMASWWLTSSFEQMRQVQIIPSISSLPSRGGVQPNMPFTGATAVLQGFWERHRWGSSAHRTSPSACSGRVPVAPMPSQRGCRLSAST